MKEHMAISVSTLIRWSDCIEQSLKFGGLHKDGPSYQKLAAMKHYMDIIGRGESIPTEFLRDVNKQDMVEALKLDFTFDHTLPQGWVNGMYKRFGMPVAPHFVWGYGDTDETRGPVPITKTGKVLLKVLQHMEQGDVK